MWSVSDPSLRVMANDSVFRRHIELLETVERHLRQKLWDSEAEKRKMVRDFEEQERTLSELREQLHGWEVWAENHFKRIHRLEAKSKKKKKKMKSPGPNKNKAV